MPTFSDEHKALAAALGIDFSKIDWAALIGKGINVLQFVLALLQGHLPVQGTKAGCEDTCVACKEAARLAIQSALVSLECAGNCYG